jgi:hypothetical protein
MRIISLGAGVQSTALLLMSDRGEIDKADYAVFADTGAEPRQVYEWLEFLKTKVSIPIIECSAGNLYDDIMSGKAFPNIPFFTIDEKGQKNIVSRQCTAQYKIRPINKTVRSLLKVQKGQRVKNTVEMMIGISIDERFRMKTNRIKWINNRWPLIEKRMSRGDCIKYVENILGRTPTKSSCIFCPFHTDHDWLEVKKNSEEWEKVIKFEKKLQTFKKIKNTPFLTNYCKPIETIDFYDGADQLDMFGNECEGMCGV